MKHETSARRTIKTTTKIGWVYTSIGLGMLLQPEFTVYTMVNVGLLLVVLGIGLIRGSTLCVTIAIWSSRLFVGIMILATTIFVVLWIARELNLFESSGKADFGIWWLNLLVPVATIGILMLQLRGLQSSLAIPTPDPDAKTGL